MLVEQLRELPFEELRHIHKTTGALIAQRRQEELEKLRDRAAVLGFTADDLMVKATKKNGARHYRDPHNPENIYRGKGPKPEWLKEALESGASLEDFITPSGHA